MNRQSLYLDWSGDRLDEPIMDGPILAASCMSRAGVHSAWVKAADFADFAEIAGAGAVDQTANSGRSRSMPQPPRAPSLWIGVELWPYRGGLKSLKNCCFLEIGGVTIGRR
jgi:hypothetical protein